MFGNQFAGIDPRQLAAMEVEFAELSEESLGRLPTHTALVRWSLSWSKDISTG